MSGIESSQRDHESLDKDKDRRDIDAKISEKYKLDDREMWVLGGLDVKGAEPDDINRAMDKRFNDEIEKAGNSGKTEFIQARKEELTKNINGTENMKEKIALYQEFLKWLEADVGTQVAEQNERYKHNRTEMEKAERSSKARDSDPKVVSLKKSLDSLRTKTGALALGNMVREAIIENQQDRTVEREEQRKKHDDLEKPLKLKSSEVLEKWPY